ncbi:uncharacterized protein [Halyomorpha halys]|uniref:uncharacterized protein n=1 Tax=Halyomorpha halys TaxID=286706 RepID=UPI0034D2AC74
MTGKIREQQYGFRDLANTNELTSIKRLITVKVLEKGKEGILCFIDLEKAFDRLRKLDIGFLEGCHIDRSLILAMDSLYDCMENTVMTRNSQSQEFETKLRIRQGLTHCCLFWFSEWF